MAENKEKSRLETGTLTGGEIETYDVLADSEEWEPIETKLVVGSLIVAVIALIIGLIVVPTSVFH